jgi:hypothetical protein
LEENYVHKLIREVEVKIHAARGSASCPFRRDIKRGIASSLFIHFMV